jgi:hypothetical protein
MRCYKMINNHGDRARKVVVACRVITKTTQRQQVRTLTHLFRSHGLTPKHDEIESMANTDPDRFEERRAAFEQLIAFREQCESLQSENIKLRLVLALLHFSTTREA